MTDEKVRIDSSEVFREEIRVIRYSPKEGEEFNNNFSFFTEIPKWFLEALEEEG